MARIILSLAIFSATLVCGVARPSPRQSGSATPAAAAASGVAGKWHFTLNTEGGDREIEALFKVDHDQVTGTWDKTDVKGTYKDGDLDLAFPLNSEEAGMTATLKIKGKLKADKLAGSWEFSEYSGTFTATKGN
jgi:hypothetical protein